MGIAIIPLHYRAKLPRVKWKKYQTQLPTWAELKRWGLGSPRPSNWGAVCGWKGLTVLDFDDLSAWAEYQRWAKGSAWGAYALTSYQVKTRRGVHLYLLILDTPNKHSIDWNGRIDIQGKGTYVLVPPSIHPSGARYRVLVGGPVLPVPSLADVLPEDARRYEPEPAPRPAVTAPAPTIDIWDRVMMASDPMPTDAAMRIKAHYRIQDLFKDTEPSGRDYLKVLCPYHDDHAKSGWVNVREQIFGCQACRFKRPKDVINVYAHLHGLTNTEAIRELLKGIPYPFTSMKH